MLSIESVDEIDIAALSGASLKKGASIKQQQQQQQENTDRPNFKSC
jgi:hypothetical protein